MPDLFTADRPAVQTIADGVTLLTRFADRDELMSDVDKISAAAKFRHMQTRGGHSMSAAMTNCGSLGWVSDSRGYRYSPTDPLSGEPWPQMPRSFLSLAERAAAASDFANFTPDACLINRYTPGAKMGAHQDRDEQDFSQPIVSVSLGLPIRFLLYGARRSGTPRSFLLEDGDVLVMGGPARLHYHGVRKLADGDSPIGSVRINLTFRRAR